MTSELLSQTICVRVEQILKKRFSMTTTEIYDALVLSGWQTNSKEPVSMLNRVLRRESLRQGSPLIYRGRGCWALYEPNLRPTPRQRALAQMLRYIRFRLIAAAGFVQRLEKLYR